jgi:hypothetical protein
MVNWQTSRITAAMLTIRQEQVRVLAQSLFESWMADHLAQFFPEEISALDPAEIRSRIRAAVERARRHGFLADSQVCRFVDLTFILGPAFDQDHGLPWAADILSDPRVKDPAMRMDLLYEAAQNYVEQIEQPDSTAEVAE